MTKNTMKVHYMSERQDWRTPAKIMQYVEGRFGKVWDPCPVNPTFDGLSIKWKSPAYCNPPYGTEISKWIKKGFDAWDYADGRGMIVIFLIPARTDTKWFHDYIQWSCELVFIRGRPKFDDSKGCAPFPSMLAIFDTCNSINPPKVTFL